MNLRVSKRFRMFLFRQMLKNKVKNKNECTCIYSKNWLILVGCLNCPIGSCCCFYWWRVVKQLLLLYTDGLCILMYMQMLSLLRWRGECHVGRMMECVYVFALVRRRNRFGGCLYEMVGCKFLILQLFSFCCQIVLLKCLLYGKWGQWVTGK